jgi:RND family efflux transporter MFP subunit
MAVPAKEGERVAAGTVIVKLDDHAALAAIDKSRHAFELAAQVMERQTKLKAIDATSDKAFQEATAQQAAAQAELVAAQAQLAQVHLATPLAGTVAHINVHPGQAVDLNTVVAEVVDSSRLVVTATVTAAEAIGLKAGNVAEIFTDSGDHAVGSAKVLFISPVVDAKTGAVAVRIAVPTNAVLRSGEFVRTRIVSEERAGRLAVPGESVVTDTEGHSVIATVAGDNAQQKSVQTGLRDGNLVEVAAEGLKEGDTVVTVGAYDLPKQTKVRVVGP